ncbi:hypothetical protein HAX54_005478 [Datura stramonium]|uniref:Uncharacterized protein n=1 Tax=Datura stramonium TaxID=4076 RepID=A0ABS8T8U8_DATST|nr:hypothetical protein [Datura stramonium]
MLEGGGGGGGEDDKGDESKQCDSGGGDDGGLKSNGGGGGDEQITGHVPQALMQSKLAAGGRTTSFGSWEFTLEIITSRRNKQKDQLILMDEKDLAYELQRLSKRLRQ